LAWHLRELNVGPDTLVGICLKRSLDMLIAMLGVLKAGGAYVPVDPAYPADRVSFMIQDSRMPILITQRDLVGSLPTHIAKVVEIDREWPLIAQQSKENLKKQASADNLAYVIYTSGSTGRPKGVMIPHCAVVNFLESMRREPGLNEKDVLLAVTTLSFDIAGLELWLPLWVGARVVIANREVAVDAMPLQELMRTSKATVMQATPATWRLLLEAGWQGDAKLKILCGGEALPGSLAAQVLPHCSELWNMYGPTETTIWSAVSRVQPGIVRAI